LTVQLGVGKNVVAKALMLLGSCAYARIEKIAMDRPEMKIHVLLIGSLLSISVQAANMQSIVNLALQGSPALLKANANVKKQQANIKKSFAGYLPQLGVFASVGHESTETVPAAEGLSPSTVVLAPNEIGVTLDNNIFNGFNTTNTLHANKRSLIAADHTLTAVINDVTVQAVSDTYALITARHLLTQANKGIGIARRTADIIHAKVKAEINSRADAALAVGRLDLAKAQKVTAINRLALARADFVRDVHVQPPKHIVLDKVPYSLLPQSFSYYEHLVLTKNPALAAVDAKYFSSVYSAKATKGNFLPALDVEMIAEHNNRQSGTDQEKNHYEMLMTATWNLYNGGADLATRRIALANQGSALSNKDSARLELINELSLYWSIYKRSREQLLHFRQSSKNLKTAYLDYQDQFSVGRRDVIQLLDAEKEYINSETKYKSQQYQVQLSAYKLFSLMGNLPDIIQHHYRGFYGRTK
jgi:outer membrane protein, adhesin transport system